MNSAHELQTGLLDSHNFPKNKSLMVINHCDPREAPKEAPNFPQF